MKVVFKNIWFSTTNIMAEQVIQHSQTSAAYDGTKGAIYSVYQIYSCFGVQEVTGQSNSGCNCTLVK
jgi:hypothetical protein